MKPHHCRYCGKLLRTWHEREVHILDRQIRDGDCTLVIAPVYGAGEREKRNPLNDTFDMRKMRERLRAERAGD